MARKYAVSSAYGMQTVRETLLYALYSLLPKANFETYLYVSPHLFGVHPRMHSDPRRGFGNFAGVFSHTALSSLGKKGCVRPAPGEIFSKTVAALSRKQE